MAICLRLNRFFNDDITLFEIYPCIDAVLPVLPSVGELRPVSVRIPGARNLIASISDDGREFLVDAESGPSWLTQCVLDVRNGEVFNTNAHTQWHCDQLMNAWRNRADRSVHVDVEVVSNCTEIVLLNTIDDLYGHSLLKLLNASRHIAAGGPGLCVLVQRHLRHLVPRGAAEIWTVDIPSSEGVQWFESIEAWVAERFRRYRRVFLSKCYPHLPPRFYDLADFVPDCPRPAVLRNHTPVIAFHARDNRLWGDSVAMQERRLRRLYHELKWRFPNVGLVLIGFHKQCSKPLSWKGWIDLRCESISQDIETEWFQVMRHTDCAVGVHGSNLLLPSGLAKTCIELLPQFKYPVIGTTFLFKDDFVDPRVPMLTHTHLFGDDQLLEVSPERLARTIASQFYSESLVSLFLLSPESTERGTMDAMLSSGKALSSLVTHKPRSLLGHTKERLRQAMIRLAARLE